MTEHDEDAGRIAIEALRLVIREHDLCAGALRHNVGPTESAAFIQSARYETIACEALSRVGALRHEEALERIRRTAAACVSAITILRDDAVESHRATSGGQID